MSLNIVWIIFHSRNLPVDFNQLLYVIITTIIITIIIVVSIVFINNPTTLLITLSVLTVLETALIISEEQSDWKPPIRSDGKNILNRLWNMKISYRIHNSPQLDAIFSCFKIHFNNIISTPRPPKRFLSFGISE